MQRVALVHGFLGSPADWADTLAVLAPNIACDVISLRTLEGKSVEDFARALGERLHRDPCDLVVGYSLGGRIALELSAQSAPCVSKLLLLSSHPGLRDASERAARCCDDDARAEALRSDGIERFMASWYAADLFASFRSHASFATTHARRVMGDAHFWADVVAGCSPGRAQSRWETLEARASETTFATGLCDARYAAIAREAKAMMPALSTHFVSDVGHVLPLESPVACARLIESMLHKPV